MKNPTNKILTFMLVGLFAFSHTAKSQDNFGDIFLAGTEDANTYLQKYSEAIGLSFNSGLGSGWYNTAKPHKLLGFDITATLNVAAIPDNDIKFQFNSADFNNLEYVSGDTEIPSLVGGSANTLFRVPAGTTIGGENGSLQYSTDRTFNAPDGLIDANDFPAVGTPVGAIQFGIGLMKNTDLKIRYASDFGALDDGSLRLIGFGVLHDLKQWIPGLKQVPVDVSGFFGYTSLKVEYPFVVEDDPTFEVPNGLAELKANSTTVQIVASKKIAILTPYVGVGYNIAGSTLKVNGEFTYREGSQSVVVNDPVDLKFTGGSTPRINAGLRIKLLVLTLHAEYAIQKYNTFTLGAGISIR